MLCPWLTIIPHWIDPDVDILAMEHCQAADDPQISGSHVLPIKQGCHLHLPYHRRVGKLCHAGALGDEVHLLLECSALASIKGQFSQLSGRSSGVMTRLAWFRPRDPAPGQQVHHSMP